MQLLLKLIIILSLSLLASANEKVSLQLLWKHQFEFAGFYIAQEKGYYKDNGLDVEIKEFDFGVDIVDDVISGKSDIGIGRSSLVLKRLEGKKILLLNALYQSSPYVLISKERSDLQTVEDFKNKKIMLSDDLESLAAISSMMKRKDIKESDYTTIPHTFNIDDLIQNRTDLMTTYLSNEPFHLAEKGIKFTIFNPKDYGFNFYADIIFTSEKYLNANSKNVEKFQEATLKGWEYAFSHIDETADLIMKKYNSQNKSKEALLYEARVLKKLAYEDAKLGAIDDIRVQEIANIYRLLGMISNTNEDLTNLIYRPYSLLGSMQRLFSLEFFLTMLALVALVYFLSAYKQYILKKQNKILEKVVAQKTSELQKSNENLEEKIKERTEELELALSAKSDFLANMSHEIRTPLNGIIGFVDILYKNEVDTQKQEKLAVVKESSHSLLKIINDILDYSKIESDKLLIEKIPLNIAHTFTHIVELFLDTAKKQGVTITLHIDERLPEQTLGDSTRIKQVFSNILSNAIKFSDKNSDIVVNVNYLDKKNMLCCEVIDSGIGIAPEKFTSIFHYFEQADSSVSRTHGGTGLGLAISKSLIEKMGGEIGVESKQGKGSKFYFTLELLDVETPKVKEVVIDLESQELKGTILIVEDNKTNQMLLSMLLDDLNLDFDIANDGVEAITAVKNRKYDVVLMDENMPNMSGKEATKIIRTLADSKDTPIIAVTANALKGDRESFLESGMNDYISKPIDADELTAMLQKYL